MLDLNKLPQNNYNSEKPGKTLLATTRDQVPPAPKSSRVRDLYQNLKKPRSFSLPKQTYNPRVEEFEYDLSTYEAFKTELDDYVQLKKKIKFEEELAANHEPSDEGPAAQNLEKSFEEKNKKRGPQIDENVRIKICDLGNGCWTFHHFTSKIQTR